MNWYVVGDLHGSLYYCKINSIYYNTDNAVIALGDHGMYFGYDRGKRLAKIAEELRKEANEMGCQWYFLDGNHDCPINKVSGVSLVWDEKVGGEVYVDPNFPNLHYFKRFGIYTINGYKCAVVAGAYSVDKQYRISNNMVWYSKEQLSASEKAECLELMSGQSFDFMFSHTCPYENQPTDLFLSFIDQSSVDNSMEYFLSELHKKCNIGIHCWGHYHHSRLEAPHMEMYYIDVDTLENIKKRWEIYDETGELPWYLLKSPKFMMQLGEQHGKKE